MAANKILITICVIQFAIISVWLGTPAIDVPSAEPSPLEAASVSVSHRVERGSLHSSERPPPEPVSVFKEDRQRAPLVVPYDAGLGQRPNPVEQSPSAVAPLVGVAAVVMLHSPKWFQRRYTLMLQNVCNNMPVGWAVQVFYIKSGGSQVGLDINPGIGKLVQAGKIVLTEMPPELNHKALKRRSDYFLIPWLWENMLADKVMLFGGGTVLCSNSLLTVNNFSSFDYIGSPWSAFGGRGGSGEISIRTRSVMLDAIYAALAKKNITKDFTNAWGLEDLFYVQSIINFIKSGRPLKLATKEDTYMFAASGDKSSLSVFSGSGTLAGLSDKDRDAFFHYCPEIKILFPSLHNPGCFGANLKREECAASICAMNPEKKSC
jgi:hypothetical protein